MKNYHKYIYDLENRKIIGDFEGAYKNCADVWPTQHNMKAPHFSYVRGFLKTLFEENKCPLNVLDIGCGYGDFVNDLTKLNVGNIIGYDISETAIQKGRKRFGPGVELHAGGVKDINMPPESCDVILLFGVLWFLLDDLDFTFSKIKKIASPNCEIFFTLNVPENPIGSEIISSYQDFTNIVGDNFNIIDAFHWYQPESINDKSFSKHCGDMLLRSRIK